MALAPNRGHSIPSTSDCLACHGVKRTEPLGFNPLLAVPERSPWIPYYGYGAGVVRLSLGDNSELGGTVGGGYVRWNFFTDLTVTVDGQVWVKDGRLTVP